MLVVGDGMREKEEENGKIRGEEKCVGKRRKGEIL